MAEKRSSAVFLGPGAHELLLAACSPLLGLREAACVLGCLPELATAALGCKLCLGPRTAGLPGPSPRLGRVRTLGSSWACHGCWPAWKRAAPHVDSEREPGRRHTPAADARRRSPFLCAPPRAGTSCWAELACALPGSRTGTPSSCALAAP